MSSFFSDTKDIKLAVHESLSDFAQNRELTGWVSAGELEDTSALYDELRALRAENIHLKNAIEKVRTSEVARPKNADSLFSELAEVLRGIDITVPKDAAGGKEFTSNLLTIFISMRDGLTTGVTNQGDNTAAGTFLYHNIAPKLAAHGLMENEKIAGVRYRRSFVSKKGLDFLAFYDRRNSQLKKQANKIVLDGNTDTGSA